MNMANKTKCIHCGIEITFAGEPPLACSRCRRGDLPNNVAYVELPKVTVALGFKDPNFIDVGKVTPIIPKRKKEKNEPSRNV